MTTASNMAEAARAFLATLSSEQRARATFPLESDERRNWDFVPRSRAGLPRHEMSEAGLEASDALIASGLTDMGFRCAKAIIDLELILGEAERREGATTYLRSPGLYYFSVFGALDGDEPWGWRVDGHHLSLNFTVVSARAVSVTPSFFGANPAEVKHGAQKGLRVLQQEEDLARSLLLSLDRGQRQRAVIYPVAPAEIITRTSHRVEIDRPEGVAAELMSGDQRDTLMSLIAVYIDRMADDVASDALKKIEAEGVGNVFFGWAGSEHRRQPHYYRIHGPSFFVEYDNTQDFANHVHSVWRDIEGDFGSDLLREHYAQAHA